MYEDVITSPIGFFRVDFQPVGGWRRSPVSCASSRAESYEDLLSDSASVASDISDSSLNSSLLGKRTLAPPSKVTHRCHMCDSDQCSVKTAALPAGHSHSEQPNPSPAVSSKMSKDRVDECDRTEIKYLVKAASSSSSAECTWFKF